MDVKSYVNVVFLFDLVHLLNSEQFLPCPSVYVDVRDVWSPCRVDLKEERDDVGGVKLGVVLFQNM